MPQKKTRAPMLRLCLHCDCETAALIGRIAATKGVTKSEVIRSLMKSGLDSRDVCEEESQHKARIEAAVEAAVKDVVKPYMERLAAILAKSTQITAASFFMDAHLFHTLLPGQNIQTLAVKARSLGSEYMKLHPGEELDTFVRDALDAIK